jgi:glutamate dehydrogenase
VARETKLDQDTVAANYFALARSLHLDWLRQVITRLPRDNRWQSLARTALRDDLFRQHRGLLVRALVEEATDDGSGLRVNGWLTRHEGAVNVCLQMFNELKSSENLDLAMLSAGMRELHNHLMA